MTTSATPQPRVKTGQYTFAEHSEAEVALAAAPELKFEADLADDILPEHRAAIEHWHGRLKDAGVAGEFTVLSLDGADSDAGGPTVAGVWKSPDGNSFGFAVDHKVLELSRYDQWNLDDNHDDESAALLKGADAVMTDEDLAQGFASARERARTADGWANRSTVRSTENIRFGLPALVEDDEGREVGRLDVTTPIGDYRVDLDRGAFTARVCGPEGELVDDLRTAMLFTHLSRSCGSKGDPDDVKYGILYALEAGTGEQW